MLKIINNISDNLLSILDAKVGYILSVLFTVVVAVMIYLGVLVDG
mgnify:FL=1